MGSSPFTRTFYEQIEKLLTMHVEKKELSNLHEAVTIVLEKQDYSESVDKSLKTLRKNLTIKGFRKGNAPMSLISKLYRETVVYEEVNKIVYDTLYQHLSNNKIETIGTPLITENNFDTIFHEEFPKINVTFEYGIKPEIKINFSKEDKITKYKIVIDQDTFDKHLKYLKLLNGENVELEEINEESIIHGKFFSTQNPDKIYGEKTIFYSSLTEEGRKTFLGKKIGDIISFDAQKVLPNEALSYILGLDVNDIPEQVELSLELKKIEFFKEAESNQELWDKIYGKGVVNSNEQFIEKLSSDLEKEYSFASKIKLYTDLKQKILSKVQIEFPKEFLRKQLLELKNNLTEEGLKKELEIYLSTLKEHFVYIYLKNQYKIDITEDDLLDGAKQFITYYFYRYRIYDKSDEYILGLALEYLKDKTNNKKVENFKFNEKLTENLESLITFEEVEITLDDFNNNKFN